MIPAALVAMSLWSGTWTADALMKLRAPGEPRISPDGRQAAYTLDGWILVQGLGGGAAKRAGRGGRPRWSGDSKRLAWLDGGRIHVDGKAWPAPGPVTAFEWVGGDMAAIVADPRPDPDPIVADTDPRHARLWILPASGKARAVSREGRHVVSFAAAADGSRAVYAAQPTARNRDAFNADLFVVDLATAVESALVSQPGRDADPSFSPDGRLVAFHSQAGSQNYFEARHVGVIAAGGGPIRYLTAKSEFDVFRGGNVFSWTADSRQIAFTAGRGVRDFLLRYDVETGAEAVIAGDVAGAASFAADGRTAVFLGTSAERPPEVFVWRDGQVRQLTYIQEEAARAPKPQCEVVRWKSGDGVEIEGVLWLPPDWRPGRRVPMLTELHGGPTGVALRTYPTPRIYPTQMFLEKGIAVFAPNFRGSSNYGAKFRLRNALSQGVGDYEDVMTGIDALVARGVADPDRLGVMGWSYGGYLTGSAITQTHRFKAASVGAPATDWTTYYGQSDGAREVLWSYFGGKPWDVPENYARHSSRSRLGEIRTPALLQVGALDINHNGEIYQALMDRGVPVEYVIYPREGHGIREPAHVRDLLERNYRWFTRWLLGER